MKRRSFLKTSAIAGGAALASGTIQAQTVQAGKKDFYELREYQLTGGGSKGPLKNYISEAIIPLANSLGIKIGAFGEFSLEDPPKVFIIFAYPDSETFFQFQNELLSNKTYLTNAKPYLELPPDKLIFTRYETYLMEAFDGIPQFKTPEKSRGLFELRTYESYNEDAARRKIEMFNKEELPLFEEVGLHPVFFAKILGGKFMPALMYMLWFDDMDEREKNWAKFISSDGWNTMKNKPEYANTVSKVKRIFLTPLDYSQI